MIKLKGLVLSVVDIYPDKILFEDVTNGQPGHRYILMEAGAIDSGGYAQIDVSELVKKKL